MGCTSILHDRGGASAASWRAATVLQLILHTVGSNVAETKVASRGHTRSRDGQPSTPDLALHCAIHAWGTANQGRGDNASR